MHLADQEVVVEAFFFSAVLILLVFHRMVSNGYWNCALSATFNRHLETGLVRYLLRESSGRKYVLSNWRNGFMFMYITPLLPCSGTWVLCLCIVTMPSSNVLTLIYYTIVPKTLKNVTVQYCSNICFSSIRVLEATSIRRIHTKYILKVV